MKTLRPFQKLKTPIRTDKQSGKAPGVNLYSWVLVALSRIATWILILGSLGSHVVDMYRKESAG